MKSTGKFLRKTMENVRMLVAVSRRLPILCDKKLLIKAYFIYGGNRI